MQPEKLINTIIQKVFYKQKILIDSKSEEDFWDKYWQNEINDFKKHGESRETRDYWLNRCNQIMTKHYKKLLVGFKNKSIVECGGGSGINSLFMAQNGAKVTITDFSKKSLEYAKLIAKQLKLSTKIDFIKADIFKFKPKQLYDVAWNCGVIEHYEWNQAINFIKLMKSFIKPKGKVLITIPNLLSYEIIYRMIKEGKGSEIFYSRRQLKKMMELAGLKNVKVEPLLFATPSFSPKIGQFLENKIAANIFPPSWWLLSVVGDNL